MDDHHMRVMEKEGCVQAPDAEVFKLSTRKSSHLGKKKRLSKTSANKETAIPESSIPEEAKQHFSQSNEINGVLSTNTESLKSSTAVPFFQYHVQATKGFRLVANLNLKRSEWVKSMETAVCIDQIHSMPASRSLPDKTPAKGSNNCKHSKGPPELSTPCCPGRAGSPVGRPKSWQPQESQEIAC